MNVLALDTAVLGCSVAVCRDGIIVAERQQELSRGQAEMLLPMLLETLSASGIDFSALDLIATTVGPGSFTGLRTGLAVARGLALAIPAPCVGVSTTEAMADAVDWAVVGDRPLLVVIDSKRGDVYVQVFVQGRPVVEPASAAIEDLVGTYAGQPLAVVGDAGPMLASALRASGVDVQLLPLPDRPSARTVAAIAARRWAAGERMARSPAPLYLQMAATGNGMSVVRQGR